ncbi:aminoacyl-tRNA hydrolase [Patescibacteria group bacterium]|nr:aminoacyl-tRNA hydrolase [Patescibacteria group bacterium]
MKLIVGLGNPGDEYRISRHNVGFIIIDKIIEAFSFNNFSHHKKFNADISENVIFGAKFILAKPQTFMNKSGEAVKSMVDYFDIDIEKDLIVIHDDIDIKIGKYKISQDRNSGGHNGIKSIIEYLGTKNFQRIRIGIEIDERQIPTEKFVLEKFKNEELKMINQVYQELVSSFI